MENTKKCPYCGGEIKAEAKKCKHCGEWLNPIETKLETPKIEDEYMVLASTYFVHSSVNTEFQEVIRTKTNDELISILDSYLDYQQAFVQEANYELINNRGYTQKEIIERMMATKQKKVTEKQLKENKKRPLWQKLIGIIIAILVLLKIISSVGKMINSI